VSLPPLLEEISRFQDFKISRFHEEDSRDKTKMEGRKIK